jgi:hypothetical protein
VTFGEYLLVGPKDARELHFAAKKLLATGINPMAERKAEAEAKQQEAKAHQREAGIALRRSPESGGHGGRLASLPGAQRP